MEFVDPFKADTGKFKKLLDEDSKRNDPEYAEIIDTDEVLDRGTIKGLPPSAFDAVRRQTEKLNANKAQKAQVAQMFNQLFTDLNTKYGLNVTLDFDSFSKSLSYVIEPTKKRALEYYLSEAYGRFRVVLYGQYLQAIALLSAQILDPAYLLSDSMTYDQKLDTMQKLYEFMSTMNEIYKEVNIPDTEMKLEKLSTDMKPTYSMDDPKVQDIMAAIFNNVTDSNKLDNK